MTDTYKMTAAAYKSAVTSIRTRGSNITRDIHRAAIAAFLFSNQDKNATPALQLAQALAAGLPRNKVIGWFHHFTNIRITVSKQKDGSFAWSCKNLAPTIKENGVEVPNPDFTVMTPEHIAEAIKRPYWDLTPETDIREVDVQTLIANALKRIDAASKAGKLKANPANDQRIAALRAMTKTLETQ